MRPSTAWPAVALCALCIVQLVAAQSTVTTTVANGDGTGTVEVLYEDSDGDVTSTRILSTITITIATTTTTIANQGQVGPTTLCTTAGCSALPTTYTVATTIDGVSTQVIATWYASTPETAIPTWTSSGSIEALASYITTTITVKGGSSSSGSSPSSSPWFVGEKTVVVIGAIFAGVFGAAIVL
ncbi:BZ3500_MvSof-1268-A1-R1_Chr3-2g06338 [Microbotryum saponariae]|uniref:BZ3500_MvSof-1268-A1-R1_Chr3-2g06338 protein n=1 Tax=Microbotryum saponariae TaxID=289078 RepID=A0A2X0LET8_9BASI|nr:BZ3500_MvSof-1268-A1-R1_Chr3-2g06338 [Microbotryum saponariae]SDA04309.1 BZ3501_MvSof-1269-A2-R1_Chr3-2g06029 [Microbotryum saponariae]